MKFLHPFTEKSCKILKYLVSMAKEIATVDKESIYQVGLYNISAEEALDDANAHRFDRLLRNVLLTYDAIWYLNLDENLVEIIETLTSIRVGTQFHNVASALRQFASHYVHPSDRERFLTFTDPKTFYERAASNPQSFISAPFRILLADGRYGWMYFTSMALVKSTSREMLVCLCRDFMIRQPDRQTIIRQMVETYGISKEFFAAGPDTMTASIWHVLMDDLGIEFFWKDCQHRFRGASKAFLQGRGVKDVTEILGKTDDDLGWLLHTSHAKENEEKVMRTGEPLLDVHEPLSIGHRIQEIRGSAYPIRESGQVIGIFIRLDSLADAPEHRKRALSLGLIDEETGLLSYSGMLMDGLQYADEFRLHGDDYTALLLDVPEYDAIGMKYGKAFRQHLLQEIVALVRQAIPTACSLARIGNCRFLVLAKAAQEVRLQQAILNLTQKIHAIEKVDGNDCTLFLHHAQAHGSEVRSIDSLLQLLVKRLHRAEEKLYGVTLYSNDNLIFPREDIRLIYEQFTKAPVFTIDDVEQFCRDSGYAPRLPNLHRLIFARLRLDDHIYGYLEVVNPAPEQMEKALPLLRALARFFSILLRNRNLMQRIDRLSKVDPLTGVMNRRGLLDALKDLPSGMYAFFFGDLNGLKETNDKLGHDAGDRLIQSAASVFVHSCPTNAVFRMGGDEFLMIQAVQDEQEASAINDRLHDRFRVAGISISLGFSMAALPAANIDTVLAEADCHMYKEKVEHHKTRHQHQETDA